MDALEYLLVGDSLANALGYYEGSKLMFVDDEPDLLDIFRDLAAAEYEEAVFCVSECDVDAQLSKGVHVRMLFTDITFPGNPISVVQKVRASSPNVFVVCMTGVCLNDPRVLALVADGAVVLEKPFRLEAVCKLIRSAYATASGVP